MQLTTYYPNGNPYIVKYRLCSNVRVYVYNITGQKISTLRYKKDKIHSIKYQQNDKLHDEHGPAHMEWSDNNQIEVIKYYQNGKQHNEHGPARLVWHDNNQIESIEYRQNDKLHNLHGPAFIACWRDDGQIGNMAYYYYGKFIKAMTY